MNETEQAEQRLKCGRYLIAVLRAVLRREEAPALPEGLGWNEVYQMARENSLESMVLTGVEKKVQNEPELYGKWSIRRDVNMVQTLTQMGEEPRLLSAFSQAGLQVLPVKGSVIRALYPQPNFRQMGDIDLLVHSTQMRQVEAKMQELRYLTEPGAESEKETLLNCSQPPYLHVEVHTNLLKDDDPNTRYYTDIWQRAVQDPALPGVYHLRTEDEYIYQLLHFIQHYVEAGVGIRQVLDIYLFARTFADQMDNVYLAQEVQKLNIGSMREQVEKLGAFWFGDEKKDADDQTLELEAFCFLSGIYGSYATQRICLMRKKQKNSEKGWKLQYIWHRLFPTVENLSMRYPRLKSAPWLAPFYWLLRLLDMSYWKEHFRSEMDMMKRS